MPTFSQLWANHPIINGDAPLLDKGVYANQCAINVSAALLNSGVSMRSFRGAWSWQKNKPKYAIRAEELASWLASGAAPLPATLTKYSDEEVKNVFDKIANKQGIIFFKDYYGPGMSGDHIDFYNGSRLTERTSWLRIHTGISISGFWSDFTKSKAVWLWELP
ncbi:type VI secretion system amidase effector protein Tae4 [Acidovorax sp. NCPPB 3576]|uniref:type VI secretion system amidase effector protein Tae4 n=1 Tax=Acidovorax sp. NCPPB 3576 TaxID=2940488 RepID=UPI0023492DB4|nr:type VI secretion system amidase effector protein Tae4 [Acidovorax sp. NCPPB 3576]WCM86543.1 type VI secretion system amidase effector protein Tae4 [Acidovorax sp. NCPPB 3576]